MFSPELLEAAIHLRWLYDRGYPSTASVKLVGDRHRLSREERQILQRGVCSAHDAARRRARLVPADDLAGRSVVVDGHNVVLTVANYIAGVRVFEADDGLVRDIGILHGRLHDGPLMTRTLDLVASTLSVINAGSWHVVFDAPISHSRDHAGYLRRRLEGKTAAPDSTGAASDSTRSSGGTNAGGAANSDADPPGVTVEVVRSGDRAVQENPADVIVTSDSALIDSSDRPVFDLAHLILGREFGTELDSFGGIG